MDAEYEAKRGDYFLASTITCYRACCLGSGATAKAEPAVPGWRVAVDWIFRA
jgi:hypothetical protein